MPKYEFKPIFRNHLDREVSIPNEWMSKPKAIKYLKDCLERLFPEAVTIGLWDNKPERYTQVIDWKFKRIYEELTQWQVFLSNERKLVYTFTIERRVKG